MSNSKKKETPPETYIMTAEEAVVWKKRGPNEAKQLTRLKLEKHDVQPHHPHALVGFAMLFDEIGVDWELGMEILDQLSKATTVKSKPNANKMNFAISVIKSLQPKDAAEALLVTQMALIQLAITFTSPLLDPWDIDRFERLERSYNRLNRTYVLQLEALKRYRSKGEQKIVVQKVTVADGGQAIVGNVTKNEAAKPKPNPKPAIADKKTFSMPVIEGDAVTVCPREPGGHDDE